MLIEQIATATLTASITSASLLTVVYVYTLERLPELDNAGIPIGSYESFADFLVLAIVLGLAATVCSLFVLLLNANFQLSLQNPQFDASLLTAASLLLLFQVVLITVGIILIHREEVG